MWPRTKNVSSSTMHWSGVRRTRPANSFAGTIARQGASIPKQSGTSACSRLQMVHFQLIVQLALAILANGPNLLQGHQVCQCAQPAGRCFSGSTVQSRPNQAAAPDCGGVPRQTEDVQMILRCLLGHLWDGCCCSRPNCEARRDAAHEWNRYSLDCTKCSTKANLNDSCHRFGLERVGYTIEISSITEVDYSGCTCPEGGPGGMCPGCLGLVWAPSYTTTTFEKVGHGGLS